MSIPYRILGSTGLEVSSFCLGTMMMGAWGNEDEQECRAMLDSAFEAGINFIDTADVYAFGESESIVGRWLSSRRDEVVLATKFGSAMGEGRNQSGGSRRWIIRAVEDSLRRLGTDWIDLYVMHRPDPHCPLEETISALDQLIRDGKVRAIGTSTFPAADLVSAQWTSEVRQLESFRVEQAPYSILSRGIESSVLPTCRAHNLGVFVWSPLNGGWLTGKYRKESAVPSDSRAQRHPDHFDREGPVFDAKLEAVERLIALASEAGMSLPAMALAFTLEHPAVTSTIIGPRTLPQLTALLEGGGTTLDPSVLDEIDLIVAPGTNLNPDDAGWSPPRARDCPAASASDGGCRSTVGRCSRDLRRWALILAGPDSVGEARVRRCSEFGSNDLAHVVAWQLVYD